MTEVPVAPQPVPGGFPVGPRSPLLMGAVGVVLLISGIANFVLFSISPGGPWELVLAFGTAVTLGLAGLAIGIVAIVLVRRNAPGFARTNVDPLAVTAVSLAVGALIIWAAFGGITFLQNVVTGEDFRFMYDVNGAFWAGIPWVLGIVFGVISYRQGRGTSNVFSLIAIGIGILLIVPTLASGVIYGLHLSP